MPLLKYFATIGAALLVALFAVSYALGPTEEPRRPKRDSTIPSKSFPKNDAVASRGNNQPQSSKSSFPREELSMPESPVAAPTVSDVASPNPSQVLLDEGVPLPKPRPYVEGDAKPLPVAHTRTPPSRQIVKGTKQAVARPQADEMRARAYTALREPSAPLPFAAFRSSGDPNFARR